MDRLLGQLRANDSEAWVRSSRGRILESIPPDVGIAKHGTANLLVVVLCVLGGGDGFTRGLATNRPAGFRDPNRLAAASSLGLLQSSLEELLAILDRIRLGVLEIRIGVHA